MVVIAKYRKKSKKNYSKLSVKLFIIYFVQKYFKKIYRTQVTVFSKKKPVENRQ